MFSGILEMFNSKDPDLRVKGLVKNKGIDQGATDLLGSWNSARTSGQDALGDYIARYMAGQKTAEANTGQEISSIDQFYNGGLSSQLGNLRARQQAAINAAADVGASEALRSANLSRLGSQGSGSSYDNRLKMAMLAPIRAGAAVADLGQERADLNYLTGNQLNLAGARTNLQNQLAQYGLAPAQMQRSMLASDAAGLTSLSQLDNLNKMYAAYKRPTDIDRLKGVDADISSMIGMAASAYGNGMIGAPQVTGVSNGYGGTVQGANQGTGEGTKSGGSL